MDIKNIRYLFAIEELKSISAAAKRLYISQPTLSQFLKKYEDDLGYPIFIRTKQGLKLTREAVSYTHLHSSLGRFKERSTLFSSSASSVSAATSPSFARRFVSTTPR